MAAQSSFEPPSSTSLPEANGYSFYDYDLDVVQDALDNPNGSEYQDHFGFRIQVKTDDEFDDDTSVDDDTENDDTRTDTDHDTQPYNNKKNPLTTPLQNLDKSHSKETVVAIPTIPPPSSSSSSSYTSSDDDDNDYTDIDIDTAITTPTASKHHHLSISSSIVSEENRKVNDMIQPPSGFQRRRSSTVSGSTTTCLVSSLENSSPTATTETTVSATSSTTSTTSADLSKSYRRPRAMTHHAVTQPMTDTDGSHFTGMNSVAPLVSHDMYHHGSNADAACKNSTINPSPISKNTNTNDDKGSPPSLPSLSVNTTKAVAAAGNEHHPSVERPSDIFRNRQSKRMSTFHHTSSSTHHKEQESARQMALKEEISNNLAQLKETSTDVYDWEFWAMVINHFDTVKQQQHSTLRDHVCVGMPPSLRGMIWQVFSKSRHNSDVIELEYRELLKRASTFEKIIERDLARTFPTHTFFRQRDGDGQEMLFNVIKAYSLYDPQVGYCQGLPFVVGCLLLHMPDEAAFCVLINLMHDYGLRGHFTPNMELLHERMFQFDELLSAYLPQVHRHLEAQGVRPTMYASQWFMTLFAYRCPLDLVFRVLDMVFTEGTSIILNVALALMKKNQATLLSLEFEGLLGFLGSEIFDVYQDDYYGFVKDTFEFTILPRELAKLSKRHTVKAAQEAKIQNKEDQLRQENYELSQRMKKLHKSYSTLTSEHQELAKRVIECKMTMARASDDNQTLRHDISQLEHRIQQTKQATENSKQDEFNRLANENTQLVQRNVQLEDHLADVEMTLIDFKMKYAQSENEYEQMKKMLGQIKKISR